jgi:hypothetical protein
MGEFTWAIQKVASKDLILDTPRPNPNITGTYFTKSYEHNNLLIIKSDDAMYCSCLYIIGIYPANKNKKLTKLSFVAGYLGDVIHLQPGKTWRDMVSPELSNTYIQNIFSKQSTKLII